MDLIEIEGLNDLINAETEMQRLQALSQMNGSLSDLYNDWMNILKKCLANVEAFIDFDEEDNIEDDVLDDGFNFFNSKLMLILNFIILLNKKLNQR
jgi:tRNA modification GTPase